MFQTGIASPKFNLIKFGSKSLIYHKMNDLHFGKLKILYTQIMIALFQNDMTVMAHQLG